MKRAQHVCASMGRSILAWLLLFTHFSVSSTKESTDDLRSFLDQLHRRLSEQLELQEQQQESRQAWCHKNLQFLADEGKHAEGIIESLRGTVRKLKNTKDDNILLVQLTEDGNATHATTQSQELALQLSTKAQLAEAQERLKLRGVASSATHRLAASLRQTCEAAEKRSASQQKALQDQISLLRTSTEAISAAEALHRIDESKVSSSLGEVSFLQMTSDSAAEIPDLLSLFRRPEPSNSEDLEELSLPFQSRPSEAHMQEVLPVSIPAGFKEPAVNVSRTPHFDCSDAALVTALQTDGFAVVRQAAEPADLSRAWDLLWKLMWQEVGWDRRDASTWTDESLARLDPGAWATGILSADRIGRIWGTDDLLTSFDGINIFRPWQFGFTKTEGDWFHVDQGRGRQGLQAVQGFVSLTDQDEFTGGLYVVLGSHQNHRLAISPSNFQRLLPPSLVEPRDGASQEAGPLPRR
ncbi:unnamed protein product [Symbiodinium sp. CCMP2592]|nr:unnamed protein product [Symbiodinium sp. CCMP2592]